MPISKIGAALHYVNPSHVYTWPSRILAALHYVHALRWKSLPFVFFCGTNCKPRPPKMPFWLPIRLPWGSPQSFVINLIRTLTGQSVPHCKLMNPQEATLFQFLACVAEFVLTWVVVCSHKVPIRRPRRLR